MAGAFGIYFHAPGKWGDDPGGAAGESPPDRRPVYGFLFLCRRRTQALRQGLRELGYAEHKTVTIEFRFAEGKLDHVAALAAELVHLKPDVIVTSGPASTRAAKEVTVTIPIVMARDIDPVGNGFVVSLARPGGNITGLSMLAPEISGKQLEILRRLFPNSPAWPFWGLRPHREMRKR